MSENAKVQENSSQGGTLQALGLMSGARCMSALIGHEGPSVFLAIFSFCVWRIFRDRPDRILGFCMPATGILGFSAALFVAAGFWVLTSLAFLVAFFLAAYRRRAKQGVFNLIPTAALDLGVVAGIGAAVAGVFLVVINGIIS